MEMEQHLDQPVNVCAFQIGLGVDVHDRNRDNGPNPLVERSAVFSAATLACIEQHDE